MNDLGSISPYALSQVAVLAELGDENGLYRLGNAMPIALAWDTATCAAFARLLDARTVAFLRHRHGPTIDRYPPLAAALAETAAVLAEGTQQNLRRWNRTTPGAA